MTPTEAIAFRDEVVRRWTPKPSNPPDWNVIIEALPQARVVIWKENIYAAAIKGSESFSSIEDVSIINPGLELWIVDTCGGILPIVVVLRSASHRHGPLFQVAPIVNRPDGPEIIFRNGYSAIRGDTGEFVRPQLAAYAFMQQGFVTAERVQLPHAMRRAAEMGRRPPLPEVSVVTLRRGEHKEYDSDHVPQHREWSCQWIVNGHWRKPSPLMKEPRPVYVRPHVKGDPTKELRAPRELVYAVTR